MNSGRGIAHSIIWKLSAVALFVILGLVLCGRISHPWTFNDDYNGAFWSQAARNLSRAGYLSSAGVPAPLYFGSLPIPADALYVHHPTLLSAMMLLDLTLLGESESAARTLPILFSLLTAVLLWLFVSCVAGSRQAAFVLALFAAAPMELHYGQMVNFEAPELFFLLAALCCFHLWQLQCAKVAAAGLFLFCILAMWTDWQGYLLVILLAAQLLIPGPCRDLKISAALLLTAFLCGCAFLFQIHLAQPGALHELHSAFGQRSGNANLSGGQFTTAQWLSTEFTYLTTLFHPVTWQLAVSGAVFALACRHQFSPREAALMHIGAAFFFIDAFYVCVLRNQSYIHDFASFYFLIPIAIFSGFLFERAICKIETRWPGYPAAAVTVVCVLVSAFLIWSGIRSLAGIDTQFCILDDDNSEPATLMPDVGRLIDRTFPPDAVVICNFDPYYSPLPYYARREMANDVHTFPDWQRAVSDAAPHPAGGILWTGATDASDLLRQLPPSETHSVNVDGVPFVIWLPRSLIPPS